MKKKWHFNFKNEILKHADFASEWRKSRFRGLEISKFCGGRMPPDLPTGAPPSADAFHRAPSPKNLDPRQWSLEVRSRQGHLCKRTGCREAECCPEHWTLAILYLTFNYLLYLCKRFFGINVYRRRLFYPKQATQPVLALVVFCLFFLATSELEGKCFSFGRTW